MSNQTILSGLIMPSITVNSVSGVMLTSDEVPVYTLTFTNNKNHTVYPFLYTKQWSPDHPYGG